MHLPKFLVRKWEYKFLQFSLYSPSPFWFCALVSNSVLKLAVSSCVPMYSNRCSVYLWQPQRIIPLPFFAPSHPAVLDSSHSHPSHCWVISVLTLTAVPSLDLIGSICSLSVPHFSHAFLELAAHGNYSASKILCLTLLLSNSNLFSFPVPHQRFLLSNWVYDLCRSVVCRFPPLFPVSQPSPVFYSVCT